MEDKKAKSEQQEPKKFTKKEVAEIIKDKNIKSNQLIKK